MAPGTVKEASRTAVSQPSAARGPGCPARNDGAFAVGFVRAAGLQAVGRGSRHEWYGPGREISRECLDGLRLQRIGIVGVYQLPGYRSAVSFSNIEVDLNDPDLGPLRESVRRWDAFAAHGEQFTQYAQFVQMVISRYARLVDSIEALSLRFDPLSAANATTLQDTDAGGASFAGMPIGIRFSRPIPDLPAFCEELTIRRLSVVSVCAAHGCIMFSLARALDVLVAARADACLRPQSRFTPGSLQSPPG